MPPRLLVLFGHGARDPRWARPFERLRDLARAQRPDVAVELAFLEFMTPSLPDLVQDAVARGVSEVTLVPVFLGQGGHVLRDLPAMLDELRAAHPGLAIRTADAVGESPEVLAAIAQYCVGSLD